MSYLIPQTNGRQEIALKTLRQIQDENTQLQKQRAALQEQVKMLRDAGLRVIDDVPALSSTTWYYAIKQLREALAATEPKEKTE